MYSDESYSNQPFFETAPKNRKRWYKKWWGKFIIASLMVFLVFFVALAFYVGKAVYLLKSGQITPEALRGADFSQPRSLGKDLPIFATEDDPSIGPKDAKVVIVEFMDFQCPACGLAYPVIKQLIRDYSDRVRFVFRDFPITDIHPQALLASMAAQCAHEQGKFFEMHDKIFENQNDISEVNLKTYAVQIGLDSIQFGSCLQTNKYLGEIEQDLQEGYDAGVKATPTFFINGQKVQGAIPLDIFQKIIISELSQPS